MAVISESGTFNTFLKKTRVKLFIIALSVIGLFHLNHPVSEKPLCLAVMYAAVFRFRFSLDFLEIIHIDRYMCVRIFKYSNAIFRYIALMLHIFE